jgi:transcriptional regulator with XRE-family HTH domain
MGERIKELRIANKLTQEELGNILGVKKAAIQKYESGKVANIKRTKIKLLAETLGVTPPYLMGFENGDNPVKKITKNDQLLLDSYHELSPDNQMKLLGMIKLMHCEEAAAREREEVATMEEYENQVKGA